MIGSKVITELKAMVVNVARLFRLAWETDRKLVTAYYLTAVIGGVAPVVGGLVVKAMIDSFNAGIGYGLALGILLLRFGMPWLESVGYWGINQSVIDFLPRAVATLVKRASEGLKDMASRRETTAWVVLAFLANWLWESFWARRASIS